MLSLQEEAEATVVFDWENGYAECSAKDNINIQVRWPYRPGIKEYLYILEIKQKVVLIDIN